MATEIVSDNRTILEHLFSDTVSYCAYVVLSGRHHDTDHGSLEGNCVHLRFGDCLARGVADRIMKRNN